MNRFFHMQGIVALFIGVIGFLWATPLYAYDFSSNGIYYNIISTTDLTCEVTYRNINDYTTYSGVIDIPPTVEYRNKTLTVTRIGKSAFFHNESARGINMPSTIQYIQAGAFKTCTGLTALVIPSSVTYIGYDAFFGCRNLKRLVIEDGEESLSLYPQNWVGDHRSPFYGCPITYLRIGRNLFSLENNTFDVLTELAWLDIGKYVISIGGSKGNRVSFYNCSKLRNIDVEGSVPPELYNYRGDRSFFSNSTYANAVVRVPRGTLDRYEAHDEWKKFWNIEEYDFSGVDDIQIAESDIDVSCVGGQIIITNAPDGLTARVFNLQGALLRETHDHIIDGLAEGIYIVSVGGKSFKVAL